MTAPLTSSTNATPFEPPSTPTPFMNQVAVLALLAAVLFIVFRSQWQKRAKAERDQRVARRQADRIETTMADLQSRLGGASSHQLVGADGESLLYLNADGGALRLYRLFTSLESAEVDGGLTIPITSIVSLELNKIEDIYTESHTDERKRGALGRAVAGEVLFGGVGAVVGAVSAGSTAKTLAREHRIYRGSELVFGLSDFDNPVVRFVSDDHPACERWLHRIRAAMAKTTLQ